MNMLRSSTLALALSIAALPALSACSNQNDAAGKSAALERINDAREELTRSNINLNNKLFQGSSHIQVINVSKTSNRFSDDPRPNAELTPEGNLLLDGHKVETTPAQHALLVKYRQQLMGIAEASLALGEQGLDLAVTALRETFKGLAGGNTDEIDTNIQAQADQLDSKASNLCTLMSPLRDTQQALAAALPEFKPYATLTKEDIDECNSEQP